MDIVKIIAIGFITIIATIILKQVKPELAIFSSIAGGIIIIFLVLDSVSNVFESFKALAMRTGLNSSLFKSVLKVVGIGYLTEFGSNVCLDAGSSSIADKITFAGKITILVLCMPIINNLIEMIIEIMQ